MGGARELGTFSKSPCFNGDIELATLGRAASCIPLKFG